MMRMSESSARTSTVPWVACSRTDSTMLVSASSLQHKALMFALRSASESYFSDNFERTEPYSLHASIGLFLKTEIMELVPTRALDFSPGRFLVAQRRLDG